MAKRGHNENHFINRIGWLRAAVLGANDGIVSTAALLVGVAATKASKTDLLITGVAALTAGALSMAAGEYVSVSSQSDTENAELTRERQELHDDPKAELAELKGIYQARGLSAELAEQVAQQLTAHNALDAHARDELGISDMTTARPIQAAIASALSFSAGSILPIVTLWLSPRAFGIWTVSVSSLIFLALLGALGAWTGGSPMLRPVIRVTFWGALALAVTAGVGKLFGAVA
ncbi:VIT family protein [Asticcacaulis sp. EMRT-3]|uniref:VIT1/CCC1 transporter family protein n=1 Tax=Asticcacaulis sp. EMRT-3 TaxID=3040349 RepID=UPI0024AEE53C|nr:VIT family protein [Asticcacaulis sp. EMRT-3]MDI7774795.1 VIT family protein [Asticcacaulis sp. EMRT-3]